MLGTVCGRDEDELLVGMETVQWHIRKLLGEDPSSAEMRGRLFPPGTRGSTDALRLFSQALVLDSLREYDSEAILLKEAVGLSACFPVARRRLAALLGRMGLETAALDQITLAYNCAQDLPTKELLRVRGAFNLAHGRIEEALNDYKTLALIYPSDWSAHADLAHLALRSLDYPLAGTEYQKAARLRGARAEAFLGVCVMSLFDGRPSDARAAWATAQSMAPEDPDVMKAGAMLEIVDNELNSASRLLENAAARQNGRTRVATLYLLVQAQIYGGRFAAAETALNAGILETKISGDRQSEALLHLTKARLHLLQEEAGEALEECRKGLSLQPGEEVLAELGAVCARLGRVEEAEAILRQLEGKSIAGKSSSRNSTLRGEIALASGRTDLAIEALSAAKLQAPDHSPSEPLARAYIRARQPERAAREYLSFCDRKAESLFPPGRPWFSGAWVRSLYEAGNCLISLGRKDEARQYFRNYLWVLDGADPTIPTVQQAKSFLRGR
jgi:Flp pilus assembly protein TadD